MTLDVKWNFIFSKILSCDHTHRQHLNNVALRGWQTVSGFVIQMSSLPLCIFPKTTPYFSIVSTPKTAINSSLKEFVVHAWVGWNSHIKGTWMLIVPFRGSKRVLVCPGVGNFVISSRALSWKNMSGDDVLYYNQCVLGVTNTSSHAHKTGS